MSIVSEDLKIAKEEPESESFVMVSPPQTPLRSPMPVSAPSSPEKGGRRGILKPGISRRSSSEIGARNVRISESVASIVSIGKDSDCLDGSKSDFSESPGSDCDSKDMSERLMSVYKAIPNPEAEEAIPSIPLSVSAMVLKPMPISPVSLDPPELEKKELKEENPEPPAPVSNKKNNAWDPTTQYSAILAEKLAIEMVPSESVTPAHRQTIAAMYGV